MKAKKTTTAQNFERKAADKEDYLRDNMHEEVIIQKTVTLEKRAFELFESDFFCNQDFLAGMGGYENTKRCVVKVINKANREDFWLVDPQGYGYARYVSK